LRPTEVKLGFSELEMGRDGLRYELPHRLELVWLELALEHELRVLMNLERCLFESSVRAFSRFVKHAPMFGGQGEESTARSGSRVDNRCDESLSGTSGGQSFVVASYFHRYFRTRWHRAQSLSPNELPMGAIDLRLAAFSIGGPVLV
jgi:hypothetical protein